MKNKILLAAAGLLLVGGGSAFAQTDATAITTAVNTAFTGVAGACITIGTFFVVYRLVRRIS